MTRKLTSLDSTLIILGGIMFMAGVGSNTRGYYDKLAKEGKCAPVYRNIDARIDSEMYYSDKSMCELLVTLSDNHRRAFYAYGQDALYFHDILKDDDIIRLRVDLEGRCGRVPSSYISHDNLLMVNGVPVPGK